jgi:hypothetical protein
MKIIGIGLNKTGTKTLGFYLKQWGFQHRTFDLDAFNMYRDGRVEELLEIMQRYDSFEDWPWALIFREIDAHFSAARFVLTVRRSPEVWYRSLCKMAVRMGPLNQFEQHIYGYSMPQGHRYEHLQYYKQHNQAVAEHFRGRPSKLLKVCWETGDQPQVLVDFLGLNVTETQPQHINRSPTVYSGENIYLAHANRILFQTWWRAKRRAYGIIKGTCRPLLRKD